MNIDQSRTWVNARKYAGFHPYPIFLPLVEVPLETTCGLVQTADTWMLSLIKSVQAIVPIVRSLAIEENQLRYKIQFIM